MIILGTILLACMSFGGGYFFAMFKHKNLIEQRAMLLAKERYGIVEKQEFAYEMVQITEEELFN